ncbi:hypothetical protein BY996DRAFT_7201769 [Phakopsora pachyrhizi]|nr:hypothetical protein BY996DRAFT_7201769 [Phakopsora pachyrhizi]
MYTDSDSSNQSFVSICTIECRGCELIEFEPRGLWDCTGSDSKTEFKEIEFEDGEWHDYDEKSGLPVSVTNIEVNLTIKLIRTLSFHTLFFFFFLTTFFL